MTRARHTHRLAVLATCLGLLSTITTAWILPLAFDRLGLLPVASSPDISWTDGVRGGHYYHSRHPLVEQVDFCRILFVGPADRLPYFNRNHPPAWAAVISLDQREGFEEVKTWVVGWPFRAVKGESWHRWNPMPLGPPPPWISVPTGGALSSPPPTSPPEIEVHGGLLLTTRAGREFVIPLRPLWPGLLANLAILSATWFAALAAARAGRSARRRRRGRCPACNYDLRATSAGVPCPECGDAR